MQQRTPSFLRYRGRRVYLCNLINKLSLQMSKTHTKSIRENFIQAINWKNSSSQYFTFNDLTILSSNKNNDFSVSHMNINLLQYHFDEQQTFLLNYPIYFQMLSISKPKLKIGISTNANIKLPGFITEHMTNKSSSGGSLLCVRDSINYKLRP